MRPKRLYARALEAARVSLRYLDPDQIPATLAPVVAHSGNLTPPLALVLFRAIDEYDWLREAALDQWSDADPEAPGPDRASALLLVRPPGWTQAVSAEAARQGAADAQATSEAETTEVARLQQEVTELRTKVKSERKAKEAAEAEARSLRGEHQTGPSAEQMAATRAELQEARREATAHAAQVDELRDDAATARSELAELREELRRVKNERAAAEARLVEVPEAWDGDPAAIARRLDEMAALARSSRPSTTRGEPTPERSLQLPTGVRPDEPAVLDRLLDEVGELVLLVDGYNAGLKLAPADPQAARRRLSLVLRAIAASSGGRWRIIVVYDSSVGHGESGRSGPVETRFAPADATADDVIVAAAAQLERVVVVSSDREVRERSEAAGAVAIWAEAITGWQTRR